MMSITKEITRNIMEENDLRSDKTSDFRVLESFKLESFNIPGFVHSQHVNLLLYGSVREEKIKFLEHLFHIEIDHTTECIFQKRVNGKWKHLNQSSLAELLTEPFDEQMHAASYNQSASESYNWVHIFDCSNGIQISEISRKLSKGRILAICFEEFRDNPNAALKSYLHSIISLLETKAREERHFHPSIAFFDTSGNKAQMWDTIPYELRKFNKYFISMEPFVLPFNTDVGNEILTNYLLDPIFQKSGVLKYTEHIFDVAVQIMSLRKKEGLLATETCLKIGEQLGMNKDEVISYINNHSKFLYFAAVLPNVVFVQPHYLIDLLSSLSKSHTSLEEHCHHSGVINEFALNSLFFSPLFTQDDFISLLKYLLLITSIEVVDSSTLNHETPTMTKEFFMPSLLPSTASSEEVEDYFKDIGYQIYLHFDGVLPQGIFLATVVALLNRKHEPTFTLGSSHTNSCNQMRCSVELFSIDLLGTVILVNSFNHIVVHFTGDEESAYDDLRSALKETVLSCAEPLALDQSLHLLNVSSYHLHPIVKPLAMKCECVGGIQAATTCALIEDIKLATESEQYSGGIFSMNTVTAILFLPIVLLRATGNFVAVSTRSIIQSIMRFFRGYEHNEVESVNSNAHNTHITSPTGHQLQAENNQSFTNASTTDPTGQDLLTESSHSFTSGTPTQREVFKQLIIINHLWYNIGIALNVSHANLSSQLQSVHCDQLKLQRVLGFWIKEKRTDDKSWATIIIAVESEIVRQKNLGKKLREQFQESPIYSLLEIEKMLLSKDVDKVMKYSPSKRALCEILAPVCYKWEEIGNALCVENGVLKCEEQSYRSDFIKLAIVLQDWFDNSCETSWSIVESAVKGEVIKHQDLALKIEEFLKTK